VGAGQYPAKYSFSLAQSASDILVFNTNETGSTTSAQIMGINALYTTPAVVFAYYNTSDTADVANTSVIFDGLGDQVAYITINGGHAFLNVLRYKTAAGNGTGYGAAVALTPSASAAAYTTCKAGATACLYRVEFANAATDTNSAPYYDYYNDRLWVGDNSGDVHMFTGVFLGTVAESGNPWGSTGVTTTLTGPVYDSTNVYVGASNGKAYLFPVASPSSFKTSEQLTSTETGYIGINDAPLLDASGGNLFFAVASDAATGSGASGNVRVPTATTGTANFTNAYYAIDYTAVGAVEKDIPAYVGSFDNVYYTSGATATTGYLTDCNLFGGGGLYFDPQLIDNYSTLNGNFNYIHNYMAVSGGNVACSPQTEVFTGTNDYAFFSVASAASNTGTAPACVAASGCVYGLIIGSSTAFTFTGTTHTGEPNATYNAPENTATAPYASSTSGLIVDNAGAGTNHVYYTTNGSGGTPVGLSCTTTSAQCVVQVSQSTLR
jgi:hypothetical protein